MELFNVPELELIVRLIFALGMGLLIGAQRTYSGGFAGLRTYGLVTLGAALFVVVSGMVASTYPTPNTFDPLRVAAQIVVGVGFLGAGVIFTHNGGISGLTTAAGLWVMSAVGMAAGFGFFLIAGVVTTLVFLSLSILLSIEEKYIRHNGSGADNH